MRDLHRSLYLRGSAAAVLTAGLALAQAGFAQPINDTVVQKHLTVGQSDTYAAKNVKSSTYHVFAAQIPGARERSAELNNKGIHKEGETIQTPGKSTVIKTPSHTPYFYPADLVYQGGGVMPSATQHALYVDYTGTVKQNWGNPEAFLYDLDNSSLIHVVDQYVGANTALRYPVGGNASINYPFYGNVIYEHDIWAIVHAAASVYGAGGGQLYHVFLPQGVDTCFDQSTSCYSPDNYSTFAFCGYHDAVEFSDIGLVLFTVLPYANVPGCAVAQPSPNGQLADSTNSILSHEAIEAITDPIPGTGWINATSLTEYGQEIADECEPLGDSNYDFLVPTFKINGHSYEVQLEYHNGYHACAAQP